MAREYFCAYHSMAETMRPLSDEEVGRLMRAALEYSGSGIEPQFSGSERLVWPWIQQQIDRDRAAYEEVCAARKTAGKKGGRPKAGA